MFSKAISRAPLTTGVTLGTIGTLIFGAGDGAQALPARRLATPAVVLPTPTKLCRRRGAPSGAWHSRSSTAVLQTQAKNRIRECRGLRHTPRLGGPQWRADLMGPVEPGHRPDPGLPTRHSNLGGNRQVRALGCHRPQQREDLRLSVCPRVQGVRRRLA